MPHTSVPTFSAIKKDENTHHGDVSLFDLKSNTMQKTESILFS